MEKLEKTNIYVYKVEKRKNKKRKKKKIRRLDYSMDGNWKDCLVTNKQTNEQTNNKNKKIAIIKKIKKKKRFSFDFKAKLDIQKHSGQSFYNEKILGK